MREHTFIRLFLHACMHAAVLERTHAHAYMNATTQTDGQTARPDDRSTDPHT